MVAKLFSIAWRSILRNKRRTAITGAAIGVGLAAMMFTDALYAGLIEYMVESSTETWMGHGQIHREGFEETARVSLTLNNPEGVIAELAGDSFVQAYTGRLISPASLESAWEMKPITLMGVDANTDFRVTSLENSIVQGQYLTGDSMEMIIGDKLAEDMQLEPGDIAVITAARADSGFAGAMFVVSGICRFGSDGLDRYTVFVNLPAAGNLLGLSGALHEIACVFPDPMAALSDSLSFPQQYSLNGNKASAWPVLEPQIYSMVEMVNVSLLVMSFILFGLVLFGIINTLFMSVYERLYEFGVMKAVGTRSSTVAVLVLLEAFWLGVVAVVIGFLLGYAVIHYFSGAGVNFGDFDFSGVMFDQPIYPVINWNTIFLYPVFTVLFTTIAGIYPGIHAGRLNPSKAMRKSL